jgi:hypothetical protein
MKIISTLQLVGAVIICGASISATSAAGQEYDPGDIPPGQPGNPYSVPEVVITGPSNPGNGCIVNYCYPGGLPPANPPYTPPPATTPVGLQAGFDAELMKKIIGALPAACRRAGETDEAYAKRAAAECVAKAGAAYTAVAGFVIGGLSTIATQSQCNIAANDAVQSAQVCK